MDKDAFFSTFEAEVRTFASARRWANVELMPVEQPAFEATYLCAGVELRLRQLASRVFANETHTTVQVPLTWWDHLKESLPKVVSRCMRPAKYREIKHTSTYETWHLCPHIDIPKQETHIRFLTPNAHNKSFIQTSPVPSETESQT